MNPLVEDIAADPSAECEIQVTAETRKIPEIVNRLNDWQYIERTVHRLLCAWGRRQAEWDDKVALHRHVWDQAEVVRRLRERVEQFPGGKADAVVSPKLEAIGNIALEAPTFQDAIDAIYSIILQGMVKAYVSYVRTANNIHDAPTITLLHEINTIKEQHYFWYRDFRRRFPHTTDTTFSTKLNAAIDLLGGFTKAIPHQGKEGAGPCGLGSDFRLTKYSNRPANWHCEHDLMPFIRAEFTSSMEARRLWWAVAYMLEMNLPDDQLTWLYCGHYMPWEWHHDVSRHLWDESRHGNSGYSRLKDWGIDLHEVGFQPYNNDELAHAHDEAGEDGSEVDSYVFKSKLDFNEPTELMTPKDLYDAVFFIGMVAENGHFIVKNESYEDFRDSEDLESAEMMLFDIIDETTHVQYAHRWLPLLAEHAGVSNDGYRQRASRIRKEMEEDEAKRTVEGQALIKVDSPARTHYYKLLERIQGRSPLKNPEAAVVRSPKPM